MCVRWLIRRGPRDFGHTRLMNAVQQFSPSDKQDEICALTFKEQISLLKNVVWVRKVTFLFFLRQLFSAYLNAVCILHQGCLLYRDFTTCDSCQLCWLCSHGRECLAQVWFVHHRQDCNFTLMPEIFGNHAGARKEHNPTFTSQAEPALLPAEQNMDLAFFLFFQKNPIKMWNLKKKFIWKLARRQ